HPSPPPPFPPPNRQNARLVSSPPRLPPPPNPIPHHLPPLRHRRHHRPATHRAPRPRKPRPPPHSPNGLLRRSSLRPSSNNLVPPPPVPRQVPLLPKPHHPRPRGRRPGPLRPDLHRHLPLLHGRPRRGVRDRKALVFVLARPVGKLPYLAVRPACQLQVCPAPAQGPVCQCHQHRVELLSQFSQQLRGDGGGAAAGGGGQDGVEGLFGETKEKAGRALGMDHKAEYLVTS
ncbi:uncharacterized protein PODANS_1_2270, partial [Podospora anserina S mat+]